MRLDQPSAGCVDDFRSASHVRRHDGNTGSKRLCKNDPEGLRFGIGLRQQVGAAKELLNIAALAEQLHARLQAESLDFSDHRRDVSTLVRPFRAAGNPQHPGTRLHVGECANQIDVTLPRFQPAR